MRRLLGCVILTAGCGAHVVPDFSTPPTAPVIAGAVGATFDYQLLDQGSGQACSRYRDLEDPVMVEQGIWSTPSLYQKAKYLAIQSVSGADNLTFIRSFGVNTDDGFCVTVTGRAYQIVGMHGGPR